MNTLLKNATNPTELANAVVAVFLTDSPKECDVNQQTFNMIASNILDTHTFSDKFEALLVNVDFDLERILKTLSPESRIETLGTYVETTGYGDYEDINLADGTLFYALGRSNLFRTLINEARDLFYEMN